MRLLMPDTTADACSMLADDPTAAPLAGATDLLVHWPQRFDEHERTFIDLGAVSELQPLVWSDDALTLGAMTTYWQVIREPRVRREFPLLIDAARQVGAIQIQSRGTWAGNIANGSPAADGVPVLMAYDAVVELASRDGTEEVPLADFYTGYKEMKLRDDQLIRAIRLPRRSYDFERFVKVGPRRQQAIAKVGVAISRSEDGWRVVASSVAPTVRRCAEIEKQLAKSTELDSPDDLLPPVRRDIAPIDDIRSNAAYRERVFSNILFHALKEKP